MRVLDFDIENRPLSYWIPDRPTAEVTAVAASWVGSSEVMVWMLGEDDPADMLRTVGDLIRSADMVTGHYIRGHDLPILNGAMVDYGLPTLGTVLAQDTKMDLLRYKDIPATQEHLSEMLGVKKPKVHMTQAQWREANRLTPAGLALTRRRVSADVIQHKALRAELLRRGWLGEPREWQEER
jgi:hypothetical protein